MCVSKGFRKFLINVTLRAACPTAPYRKNWSTKVLKENVALFNFLQEKTTYPVWEHFSESSTEMTEDKIKHMLREEVRQMMMQEQV